MRCKCGHTDLENTTIVDCMPVSPADQMFLMVILGMRIEFFYRVSDTKQPIPEHWIRRPFDKMMTNLKKKRAVEEVH